MTISSASATRIVWSSMVNGVGSAAIGPSPHALKRLLSPEGAAPSCASLLLVAFITNVWLESEHLTPAVLPLAPSVGTGRQS
jgi:hypothetical protein